MRKFAGIRRSFFVGIENEIIRNTRQFPHCIKIEDILSLDDDIFRKAAISARIKIEGI